MRRARFILLGAVIIGGLLNYLDVFRIIWARNELASNGRSPQARATEAADSGAIPQTAEKFSREGGASRGRFQGFDTDDLRGYGKFGGDFLRDRGESAYNLLAVFAASGGRKYLLRALERFPADPAVLYLGIANSPNDEDPASLIERL